MDTSRTILRSARHFFVGTFLSRISGLARDMAMAFTFGSSPEIAAFMVSYRLANLFRRILGEGNLQSGFAPHYKGPEFYREISSSLAVLLLVVIGGLEAVLWGCTHLVGPDWKEIIELTMWMVPGLFFISLYGLNSALLQYEKKYFTAGVAPVAFNLIWIITVLMTRSIWILSISVTVAFAAQWLATAIQARRILGPRTGRPKLFSDNWKAILKPLCLGIIGISAVQLNSALDAIFARFADPEGPAFLWYAIRIEQLPLALFGIALSGALLPPLSRAIKNGETDRYRELLQGALRQSAALMLVCTFGIFALGPSGINILFGHGDFTLSDVAKTYDCLWAYGIGLTPAVFVLLLASGHYAQKNYRTPTIASLVSVVVNMGLNALFVFGFGWGAKSIAIATSVSAFVNMAILGLPAFDRFWMKMIVNSVIPCLLTMVVGRFLGDLPRALPGQMIHFGLLSGVYLAGVGLTMWRARAEVWGTSG